MPILSSILKLNRKAFKKIRLCYLFCHSWLWRLPRVAHKLLHNFNLSSTASWPILLFRQFIAPRHFMPGADFLTERNLHWKNNGRRLYINKKINVCIPVFIIIIIFSLTKTLQSWNTFLLTIILKMTCIYDKWVSQLSHVSGKW